MVIAMATLLGACGGGSSGAGRDPDSQFPGGAGATATLIMGGPNAFGFPAPALSSEEVNAFQVGNALFRASWVAAGNSTTARDGLGPLFNARSCSACHLRDGRGAADPQQAAGLLIRLPAKPAHPGVVDVNYGRQVQDVALPGVLRESSVRVEYTEQAGVYPDGTVYSLRRPTFTLDGLRNGPLDDTVTAAPRSAPQVFGMGLLEAIPESRLRALADPDDSDGDGVSGRVNTLSGQRVGRFGWKAEQPDVLAQTAGAFAGDLGITSSLLPDENCTPVQADCAALPNGGTPEIDDVLLGRVEFYIQTLAVPARRDFGEQAVIDGERLFSQAGCDSCHVPSHQTGVGAAAALSHQKIFPYTDLLLHDMGSDLAEDSQIGSAQGSEWRTPPLWGLGLAAEVAGQPVHFMHDGRARSLEEAILWHGGEAEASRESFKSFSAQQRAQLLQFLESL